MSIQAISWVLERSKSKGAERLVLLSIANHAGDDGTAYPGVATIAREALVTEKSVRRCLIALERLGELKRLVNGAPDERIPRDKRPNLYTIVALGGYPNNGYPKDEREGHSGPGGGDNDGSAGTPGSGTKPSSEPSVEPSGTSVVGAADADLPRPEVAELCEQLAEAVKNHRGGHGRPTVTKAWLRDMRLLLARGPLGVDDPQPVTPAKVTASIEYLFTRLAEPSRSGFCWADQVRSPAALRDHWHQLALERRHREATTPTGRSQAQDALDEYRRRREATA